MSENPASADVAHNRKRRLACVGKKPFSLQRHGDLGTALECFQGVAEGLGTSLKPFEGFVCGARVKSPQQGSTKDPDQGTLAFGEEREHTHFCYFPRIISEGVRTIDVAWKWLEDSELCVGRWVSGGTCGEKEANFKSRSIKTCGSHACAVFAPTEILQQVARSIRVRVMQVLLEKKAKKGGWVVLGIVKEETKL
ncbi:hypothetical protein K438DRAFT_1765669 [Mycena galopus ATCC 62051]|nr:hypothetical protein K438DRAFT_1765669 [Mycena galopus ATCC 62051]